MCCNLLHIPWMDSPAGDWCKHCDVGKGCKIYNKAPTKCLAFRCAYNQMEKASVNLRPDKCGIIFEKIEDKIFIGTVNPTEDQLKEDSKGQINAFLNQGFSVVLFNQKAKIPLIYTTKDQTAKEVWDIIQKEKKIRYGSTSICN